MNVGPQRNDATTSRRDARLARLETTPERMCSNNFAWPACLRCAVCTHNARTHAAYRTVPARSCRSDLWPTPRPTRVTCSLGLSGLGCAVSTADWQATVFRRHATLRTLVLAFCCKQLSLESQPSGNRAPLPPRVVRTAPHSDVRLVLTSLSCRASGAAAYHTRCQCLGLARETRGQWACRG